MFEAIRPVSAAEVSEFVEWRYPSPYDVYDLRMPLDEAIEYFLTPDTGCHAVLSAEGLAGYCTFGADARVPGGDDEAPALDIGAALAPDLTGRGLGTEFVSAIVRFALTVFEPPALRVSIASANPRAIRVWVAAGFVETQRFRTGEPILGSTEFIIFQLPLDG